MSIQLNRPNRGTLTARSLAKAPQHRPQGQQGYILIAAIVVMLILAGIAVTLAKLSISQNSVVEQSLLRARTELALSSASQWVAQATLESSACIAAPNNVIYFNQGGLNVADNRAPFSVSTLCSSGLNYTEGSDTFTRYPTELQADYLQPLRGGDGNQVRKLVVRRSVMEF